MPNRHTNLSSLFTDIAGAIRTKTGSSATIVADNFDTAIANIPSASDRLLSYQTGLCTGSGSKIIVYGGVINANGVDIGFNKALTAGTHYIALIQVVDGYMNPASYNYGYFLFDFTYTSGMTVNSKNTIIISDWGSFTSGKIQASITFDPTAPANLGYFNMKAIEKTTLANTYSSAAQININELILMEV